jgi:hypothetical protein
MRKFNLGQYVKVLSNYLAITQLQGFFVNAEIGDIGIVFSYVEDSVKVLFGEKEVYFTEDMLGAI